MKDSYFFAYPFRPYDFRDKSRSIMYKMKYMLARTAQMFRYDGLPDTIPQRMLELYLQVNGYAIFYEYEGKLYAFRGGLGGEPDEYYRPTIATISNPALELSVQPRIDTECVVMYNDTMLQGLMPLCNYHATQLVENEMSLRLATINSRMVSLLSASDDRTRQAADKYIQDVIDGKLGVIAERDFVEGINGGVKVQPYANATQTQNIKNLIEWEQYLKASWFNSLGLDANYNMKRETLTDSENGMNRDSLYPLIDDMLYNRKLGLGKVNAMYGTNITVSLNSAWEDNQEELDAELGNLKEPEEVQTDDVPDPET